MGKTVKGKDKAKAKVAKAKAKIARKTKRGLAAVAAAFALAFLLTGCATSESAQPAKSATMNNTFDDCIIIVATKAKLPLAGTNRVAEAEGGNMPTLELFTQTQSLESTGSTDTFSPTATQTPTTDVKPDITANYAQGGGITNRGTGGAAGTGGVAGIFEKLATTLTDEGLAALKSAIANKTNGTITLQKKDGTTTTATCADGSCTFADGTTVTAADCAACTDCAPK